MLTNCCCLCQKLVFCLHFLSKSSVDSFNETLKDFSCFILVLEGFFLRVFHILQYIRLRELYLIFLYQIGKNFLFITCFFNFLFNYFLFYYFLFNYFLFYFNTRLLFFCYLLGIYFFFWLLYLSYYFLVIIITKINVTSCIFSTLIICCSPFFSKGIFFILLENTFCLDFLLLFLFFFEFCLFKLDLFVEGFLGLFLPFSNIKSHHWPFYFWITIILLKATNSKVIWETSSIALRHIHWIWLLFSPLYGCNMWILALAWR